MSGYKVVPMEPTAEMVEAAQDAYMPFGDMNTAIMMAVLAAPAVQGEPAAWKEPAANWLREKAAAQQAMNEQYPEHAKCYPTWGNWVLKLNWLADELSVGVAPQPAPNPTFQLGDHVRKTKGSQWKGRVVGTYSTTLTPEGYAVESDTEKGSVQIYPVGALELVGERLPC